MRRQPQPVPVDPYGRAFGARPEEPEASSNAGRQIPFLVSGGKAFYLLADGPPIFDPRPAGVQLICSVYIGPGHIGFLKSIRVAPYMPTVLGPDPVSNDLLRWRVQDAMPGDIYSRPSSTGGLWTTPAGWEGYFDRSNPEAHPPRWWWHLRLFQGPIDELRARRGNVPLFSITDSRSWFMVEEIPVPAGVYAAGLPGQPVGYPFPPQKYQVLPGDGLRLHVPIPPNSTLCLFATWEQGFLYPYTRTDAGNVLVDENPYYPLLPSIGQLAGYALIDSQPEAVQLAKAGW